MRPARLDLLGLRCPSCHQALVATGDVARCGAGHEFPASNGYVDLWPGTDQRDIERTIDSFGFEWTEFDAIQPEDKEYWSWYFADVPHADLAGMRALDAGCGKGRYTRFTAEISESMVALDGSVAVAAAARNMHDLGNVLVIRSDIHELPFPDEHFGFVSCLGVLHHLPDPEAAFGELVRVLAPAGRLLIYVYSRPTSPGLRSTMLGAARVLRGFSTRMPHRALLLLAAPIAAVLYVLFVLPGDWLARAAGGSRDRFPLHVYRRKPIRSLWLDTFDRLSAPIERRYIWPELEPWYERRGLVVEAVRHDAGIFVLAKRADEAVEQA